MTNFSLILENLDPIDVKGILHYIYEGEITISPRNYEGFIKAAKFLQVDDMDWKKELGFCTSGVLNSEVCNVSKSRVWINFIQLKIHLLDYNEIE